MISSPVTVDDSKAPPGPPQSITNGPRVTDFDTGDEDLRVASLDPLGVDSFLPSRLPNLNLDRDVRGLVRMASELVERADTLKIGDRDAARAATRDVGMLAASLMRHHLPLESVRGLEETLIRFSEITNEVPRDTVFSYGPRNPLPPRTRTFTGSNQELSFIKSFRKGMQGLGDCLVAVDLSARLSVADPMYIQAIGRATAAYLPMAGAIIEVLRAISPEYFTFELRPYFDPYAVGGRVYLAPGGAHMPVLLVDWLVWGAGETDAAYLAYFGENIAYLPPTLRTVAAQVSAEQTLATLAIREVAAQATVAHGYAGGLLALRHVLQTMLRFRYPHRRVARANFAVRSTDDVGSGGYRVDILEHLIDLTQAWKRRVDESFLGVANRPLYGPS